MKNLITEDAVKGREDHGLIAEKRQVGVFELYLTYQHQDDSDPQAGMWWIVWIHEGRLRKMGWTIDRRADCWQAFMDWTEADLARMLPS